MQTSATNRRVRVLLTDIRTGALAPRPDFQRRLVWTNKHKIAFIQTVLKGYPFPEIYIAAGEVDPNTGEGKEMLVDGQQRLTTLKQYFDGSPDLKLSKEIIPYSKLPTEQKVAFLEYEVVIRDLGKIAMAEIKEIFERINSTNYALNAMEIQNARFDGEMKRFAEKLARDSFFRTHQVFSTSEARRMFDTRFALSLIITVMSAYFNHTSELETFLSRYNDEFEKKDCLNTEFQQVFQFINKCRLPRKSRAWRKADLFSLLVEVHRALIKNNEPLEPVEVRKQLQRFYALVDKSGQTENPIGTGHSRIVAYFNASKQATNNRASRINRGKILQDVINGEFVFDNN